jgi:hypothetical protein
LAWRLRWGMACRPGATASAAVAKRRPTKNSGPLRLTAYCTARNVPPQNWLEVKAGVAIGVAIALGYGLQTWGLQSISSSKSATCCWRSTAAPRSAGHTPAQSPRQSPPPPSPPATSAGAAAAVAVPGAYAGGDVLRGDCAGLYRFDPAGRPAQSPRRTSPPAYAPGTATAAAAPAAHTSP